MQKQLELKYILMSSADRVAHRWATHAIIVSNTHALPAEYKMPKNNKKTEQSIYECLLGFCFNNISAPPQILAASTVFFCPIPETKMMGDGFLWCYCCRFVLNSKRLLSTSCNKRTAQ